MIGRIKNELRIDDACEETITSIQDLIDSAKADLKLSGVHEKNIVETDPLIKRAIILYCKANHGYDPNTEKFQELYTSLKHHLTLSTEYTEYTEVI